MGRHLVAAMSALLGQQFVVVNRDGASGTIGFGTSPPRGPTATRSAAGPTTSIIARICEDLRYGVDSFEYILPVVRERVHGLGAARIAVSLDRRSHRRRRANRARSPTGIGQRHRADLSVSNLAYRLGLNVVAIAYRGETAALPDVIAGPSISARLRWRWWSGRRCRAGGVRRPAHPSFPEAPTFSELGMPSMPPGLNGLFAPKERRPGSSRARARLRAATQSESFRAGASACTSRCSTSERRVRRACARWMTATRASLIKVLGSSRIAAASQRR